MTNSSSNAFEQDLPPGLANYAPLTPLSLMRRSVQVYAEKTAIVYGERQYSYREFGDRCARLASALRGRGVGGGDAVAVIAPNTPPMLEAHLGIPMAGAVINALNYRLDAATIRFILQHGGAKVLIADREFATTVREALQDLDAPPLLVAINDPQFTDDGKPFGDLDYEALLAEGDSEYPGEPLTDEWQAISLCYTSGTTGNPKGVVTHHRGAYLNALGNALTFGLRPESVYLWTLPMFHCNGWTFTWAVTALGATHVCLRRVEPALIFALIDEQRVSHMCGAPVVLSLLIHAPEETKRRFQQTVEIATGGAAPPSQVIADMSALGFQVTHLYGLTETYGPAAVCAPQSDWGALSDAERAARMARQGVRYATMEDLCVADPETMQPVPWDGTTMGELMLRGNTVMKGYFKNPEATAAAFAGGWYHSGDLGVRHADGYVEIKDRSKDVIISGGENISSLEIEEALYRHPAVMEAAVVARPDTHWGETPCAFVALKPGANIPPEDELIDWCRRHLASFKIPRTVVYGELPKTSTGKIQKYLLRDQASALNTASTSQ